ncbi:hypothetical protein L226DRAFT_241507 [Lentinus tigrinus ALCF2SS1-7]|uniref:uncharacterized protein n=1 Tax=Lentinus tigrinus ALCF2SS1-7 TaxID=1328758 RepID=UPI001165F9E6|nr:hypothetical protein L226DRAFT_241507 [Lentinus tigrinus ALCF2SS1-7]
MAAQMLRTAGDDGGWERGCPSAHTVSIRLSSGFPPCLTSSSALCAVPALPWRPERREKLRTMEVAVCGCCRTMLVAHPSSLPYPASSHVHFQQILSSPGLVFPGGSDYAVQPTVGPGKLRRASRTSPKNCTIHLPSASLPNPHTSTDKVVSRNADTRPVGILAPGSCASSERCLAHSGPTSVCFPGFSPTTVRLRGKYLASLHPHWSSNNCMCSSSPVFPVSCSPSLS